jgi:hypothetical protein
MQQASRCVKIRLKFRSDSRPASNLQSTIFFATSAAFLCDLSG